MRTRAATRFTDDIELVVSRSRLSCATQFFHTRIESLRVIQGNGRENHAKGDGWKR